MKGLCSQTGRAVSLAAGAFLIASRGLVDFLLPPACPLCREDLATEAGICPRCLEAAGVDPSWRSGDAVLHAVGNAAAYGGATEEMIKGLKYSGRLSLARPLGRLLAQAVDEQILACTLVAPVPLHPRRLAERGFNQSLLLVRELSGQAGLPAEVVPRLLVRSRYTRPQVELPAQERQENVRGAFAVAEGREVAGHAILLVDDVFTTGATLVECATVLRRAGAARVLALTVARAL
ncbi:MAG: ComF family protein [Pseudomonadota bacterium]